VTDEREIFERLGARWWDSGPHYHADTARRVEPPTELRSVVLPGAEPTRTTAPSTAPLALQFATTDGLPLVGVDLQIRRGSYTTRLVTDADGCGEIDVPDEGVYDVITRPPLRLPPCPEQHADGGEIYARKLPRDVETFEVGTGERRRILIARPTVTEVVLDGYAEGHSVMRWGGMRARSDGSVGTARGALRMALWLARGRTMSVVGHADPEGSDAANDELALVRAQSVYYFASGNTDEWAAHAAAYADELDFACAMVACHRILGLGLCGLDDEERLDAAHAAVRASACLADDAPIGVDDWKAISGLYEIDLATLLFTDLAGLAEIRSAITWADPPVVGVGERHPRPLGELVDLVGPPALAHRRASLCVFGSASDTPNLAMDAGGDELYDGTYRRTIVSVPGEVLVDIAVDRPSRDPIARGRAWISVGGIGVHEHTATADGHIRFLTLAGDDVEVVAAFDRHGRGAMVAAGTENA
jgi:hypothetical protein